ncbi:SURF1 family protein [Enterovibrio paralichthyis]|uniref:SURF1 family protein n=1 Tax=Enterovibrio paralichthyis TaxID=2853805 RepID=UPI001C4841FF|nr:SURF1 family protein [Enterovibrio paralichthyis]
MGFLLFTVAAAVLLVKLGLWQMSRGAEKAALLESLAVKSQQTVTSLEAADGKGAGVSLSGSFAKDRSVLLDNQTHEGRVGYRWFAPFQSGGQWVLAELGWVAAPASRESLPELPTLSSVQGIRGILDKPSKRIVLGGGNTETGWPRRVQTIEPSLLGPAMGLTLSPWVVRVNAVDSTDNTFSLPAIPVWEPVVMKPEKHYAYAAQWFGLALVVVVGFGIWWRRTSR